MQALFSRLRSASKLRYIIGGALLVGGSGRYYSYDRVSCSGAVGSPSYSVVVEGPQTPSTAGINVSSLPKYTKDQVASHKTLETGIWVTFEDGVYDITEFYRVHPGSSFSERSCYDQERNS